jgi:hypothetical protein
MRTQPMTSAKKFTERYPEIVEAVHAAIRAQNGEPDLYGFTIAEMRDGVLEGAYYPHQVTEARDTGGDREYPYTWYGFSAQSVAAGPLSDIKVNAVSEFGDGAWLIENEFHERFPEVRDAVEAAIRSAGENATDYAFSSASIEGSTLEGGYLPQAVKESFSRGNYDLSYTWFAFTAALSSDGPPDTITVEAVPEDNADTEDDDLEDGH